MNRTLRTTHCRIPLAYAWTHAGARYRVTPWPEVRFERCYGSEWIVMSPRSEALAAAAGGSGAAWRSYLEFVPIQVRELVGLFRANRIPALYVAAHCPDVVGALTETPALVPFLLAQATGSGVPRWHEVNAVYERNCVYGLLEWLGLPARRETLSILRNLVSTELSPVLLEPLRRILWAPDGIFALAELPTITERELVERSQAMAA